MDAGILPEVYRKVLTAKKYLATGKAASVKEAAQLAGISRSAYYKYKDAIFEYGTSVSDEVATVKARLQDSAGVLSSFIGAISLSILPEALRDLAQYRQLIYGVLLVLLMMVKPQGLLGDINFKYIRQRMEHREKSKEAANE